VGHPIALAAALTCLTAFSAGESTIPAPAVASRVSAPRPTPVCAPAPLRPSAPTSARPCAPAPSRPCAPPDTAALQRLLSAEDRRGTGPEGLAPLLDALTSPDTLLRRVAVRGLGRMQRPALGKRLVPLLADSVPAVRAEAANAVAQSLRRVPRAGSAEADSAGFPTREAAGVLARALAREADSAVADALAQALGRLPLPDSAAARTAEAAIRARVEPRPGPGAIHGLYTLARARKATGDLAPETIGLLRRAAVESPDTLVRRLALRTLATAAALDSATAVRGIADRDDESRRMTLRGAGPLAPAIRGELVRRGFADPAVIVRIEAIAAARLGGAPPDCGPILGATRDPSPAVALTAVDSLASGCADSAAADSVLRRLAAAPVRRGPPDHRWQLPAHALLALSRLDRAAAAGLLPAAAGAQRWDTRVYAARAAAVLDERGTLYRLARDPDHNVQEAAIVGLAATAGHEADSVYLRALGSRGNQVVLAAAEALRGSPDSSAGPAALAAFERLSAGRTENARDPRVVLLGRIGELGSARDSLRLRPYLADYDTTVAAGVAATIATWSGDTGRTSPSPLPLPQRPLAETFLRRDLRLRVTMAPSGGGGRFVVRLFPSEAPATVARVLRLVRQGFYDGKVFQRVEPNFVVQGGGPDASEYVGDATFMRDELTARMHARGTVGISTRGRDTGDGQWFINLVDNPLLDHEFTLFGEIAEGRAAAEAILEGDRIARIEVVEVRR
jgi:cyclophilin family peptidyl-prolyl cis-trans isomerase